MVTKEQMNEVLRQLAAIYPAWQQAIKTQDHADNLKRVWWDEFNRLGMEPDDLKRGVIRARSSDSAFLPSLGQFIGWCRDTQLPTKRQAWQEATEPYALKSGLVFEAYKRTGSWAIKQGTKDSMQLFFDHYDDVIEEYREGARFEDQQPKKAIQQDKQESNFASKEKRAKMFAELRNMLEGKTNVDNT